VPKKPIKNRQKQSFFIIPALFFAFGDNMGQKRKSEGKKNLKK